MRCAPGRIAPPDDPDRPNAEEALQLYLPRAVYALGTLINRLDQLTLPPARRRALQALLLHACDLASSLWSHGPERARPRSLQLPGTFLENNVWKALEEAATLWTERAIPVPVTVWPDLPLQTGGLCIFEGALRDLVPRLGEIPPDGGPPAAIAGASPAAIAGASPAQIAGALGVYPRPNQAFWTLSALWAGWLWGRESAAPFKSVLRRRRYDWQWHAEALRAALGSLKEALSTGASFFALLAEAEPPFISAALAATGDAGFALEGVSMRSTVDPLQLLWKAGPPLSLPPNAPHLGGAGGGRAFDKSVIQAALGRVLAARAEPLAYMPLQLVGTAALLEAGALPLTSEVHTEAAQRWRSPSAFKARTSDERYVSEPGRSSWCSATGGDHDRALPGGSSAAR
jgi:hypothetical protein